MSASVQTVATWHVLFDTVVQQLGKKASGEKHQLGCHIEFGGKHNVHVHELSMERVSHQLVLHLRGWYTIGKQCHSCKSYKIISHVFSGDEGQTRFVLSDSVRTLIGQAIDVAFKEVRQICNVCQRQIPGRVDEKTGVCQSCENSAILTKFLSEQEQKSTSFGAYGQKECAICLDAFSPTSHVGQNDGCEHVFHYHCLCSLTKPKCPLCKAHIGQIKRMSDSEWLLFRCDDEDEDMN